MPRSRTNQAPDREGRCTGRSQASRTHQSGEGGGGTQSTKLPKQSVFPPAPPPAPSPTSAALLSGVSQRTRDAGLQAAAALQGGPPSAVRGDRLRVLQPRWGHSTAGSKCNFHICFHLLLFFFGELKKIAFELRGFNLTPFDFKC